MSPQLLCRLSCRGRFSSSRSAPSTAQVREPLQRALGCRGHARAHALRGPGARLYATPARVRVPVVDYRDARVCKLQRGHRRGRRRRVRAGGRL